MNKQILLSIAFLVATFTGFAQRAEPTKWQTRVSKTNVKAGETVELIFTADIDEGWYLYSSDFDPDLGPVVATFSFRVNDTYETVGEIKPVGAKSKEDTEIWMGTYTYFKKKAEFRQTVKILKENPEIKVKLNAQACSDETGQCVPVIRQFTFENIKVEKEEEKTVAPEPAPDKDETGAKTEESVKTKTFQPSEATSSDKTGKKSEKTKTNEAKEKSASNSSVEKNKKLDPNAYSSKLEYLKAEKKQLVKTTPTGEDKVREELKDFVSKYGNK